jgi:hypothetical protein
MAWDRNDVFMEWWIRMFLSFDVFNDRGEPALVSPSAIEFSGHGSCLKDETCGYIRP